MRMLALPVALITFAVATTSGAREEVETPRCTPEAATSATMETIKSDVEKWRGACVAIDGLLWDAVLYSDRDALRPEPSTEDGYPNDILQLGYIDVPRVDGPLLARVIGRIDNCGLIYKDVQAAVDRQNAEREAKGDGARSIVFLRGLCHYTHDTYLEPVSITYRDLEPVTRFTTAEIPVEERDIVDIPPERQDAFADHLRYARAMIDVLAEGNEIGFYLLSSPDYRAEDFSLDDPSPWAGYTLDRSAGWDEGVISKGEFSQRWQAYDAADWVAAFDLAELARDVREQAFDAPKIFVERNPADVNYTVLHGPSENVDIAVCWCLTAECRGKWPATLGDTYIVRQRPYFCVRPGTYVVGRLNEVAMYVEPPSYSYGMAEPEWPE